MRRLGGPALLGAVGVLASAGLQVLPTAVAAANPHPSGPSTSGKDHRIERRSADGKVTFLGSTDARALEPGPGRGHAVAAARAHLDSVGRSLGLNNPRAEMVDGHRMALGQGRSIVRFDQQIGGLPVFAGQVVVGLDSSNALTSVLSDVSPAAQVAAATVAEKRARRVALSVTSSSEDASRGGLAVQSARQVAFDPSVAHVDVPGGARPAWEVQVGNGTDIREMVVVDGTSGRVLLHYNQVADALNRTVCNNHNVRESQDIPCTDPVRVEGQAKVKNAQINDAYRIAGQTAQFYQDVAGVDLTEFIGLGKAGHRQLRSTVNWCYANTQTSTFHCPYDNAFWNGQQMYYGSGYASADDVVAHELSHGVTQHTSDLMYYYQSGAMNESFSDIMGEIVDHRNLQPGSRRRRSGPSASSCRVGRSGVCRTRPSTTSPTR